MRTSEKSNKASGDVTSISTDNQKQLKQDELHNFETNPSKAFQDIWNSLLNGNEFNPQVNEKSQSRRRAWALIFHIYLFGYWNFAKVSNESMFLKSSIIMLIETIQERDNLQKLVVLAGKQNISDSLIWICKQISTSNLR